MSDTRSRFEEWLRKQPCSFGSLEEAAAWDAYQAAEAQAVQECEAICKQGHPEDKPGDYAYAIRAAFPHIQE